MSSNVAMSGLNGTQDIVRRGVYLLSTFPSLNCTRFYAFLGDSLSHIVYLDINRYPKLMTSVQLKYMKFIAETCTYYGREF